MKKLILLISAIGICSVTFAQHNQTDSKTDIQTTKAMLDGKSYSVTLTENIVGTTGTPGTVADDRSMENHDLTKRDVERPLTDKSGSMNSDLKDNRKMLLRFENGDVKISGKGGIKNESCAYKSWGMESTGISFSADCSGAKTENENAKSNAGTILTGTVNGDTIHGTMTCTKDDGSVKSFSYTGSKAGPNDLDLENEMGLK